MDSLMLSSSRKKRKNNGVKRNSGSLGVPLWFYEKLHAHVIFVHKINVEPASGIWASLRLGQAYAHITPGRSNHTVRHGTFTTVLLTIIAHWKSVPGALYQCVLLCTYCLSSLYPCRYMIYGLLLNCQYDSLTQCTSCEHFCRCETCLPVP